MPSPTCKRLGNVSRRTANGGAGGIDGMTIEMFARRSAERLAALSRDVQAKTYRPKPVRRVFSSLNPAAAKDLWAYL